MYLRYLSNLEGTLVTRVRSCSRGSAGIVTGIVKPKMLDELQQKSGRSQYLGVREAAIAPAAR